MKKIVLVSLIVVGFSLFMVLSVMERAVQGANKPDWINSESSRYPGDRFLTGVGSGDSRKKAENSAYAAISRIFVAEIDQRTREWEKFFQKDEKGKSSWQRDIKIDQFTSVSTRKVLENVSIAEIYLDKKNQIYYALAVINRRKAVSALRQRITSLDLEIEEMLKMAGKTDQKLQKVRLLHKAIRKILLRDTYNTELQILSLAGSGAESLTQLSAIQKELQDFLSGNFQVIVFITGKNSDSIRKAVVEGLNSQGLPVSLGEISEKTDLVIKGSVAFQPVEISDAHFVRWNASFELRDIATGQIIGSVLTHGREGHITEPEAEARALRAAQHELSKEISERLADYIFGEKSP